MSNTRSRASTGRNRIEQKERAILDAARSAFVEKGFQGAKIAEIAKAAGVSEGSVYFYYANKDELMHAVLGKFWEDLTKGAALSVDPTSDTFEQAVSLAKYHLNSMIQNSKFIDLQLTLRGTQKTLAGSREQLRLYVSVLDEIVRRGVDRGVIKSDVEIWLLRDVYYGSLDYAARTLTAHGGRQREAVNQVVNHLVSQIFALHGVAETQASKGLPKTPSYGIVLYRLESIATRLEAALSPDHRPVLTPSNRKPHTPR